MITDPRMQVSRGSSRRKPAFLAILFQAFLVAGALLLAPQPPAACADSLAVSLNTQQGNPELRWEKMDAYYYREMSFEHLNDFEYIPPGGARVDYLTPPVPEDGGLPFKERFPGRIRDLDGQRIAIPGFLMPLDGRPDAMTSFALVRSMAICCYGVAPKVTEWIMVEARPEQKLRYYKNVPVLLRGVLKYNEVVEEGWVISLLEMKADELERISRKDLEAYYERTGVQ